jgi:hypothetical protein
MYFKNAHGHLILSNIMILIAFQTWRTKNLIVKIYKLKPYVAQGKNLEIVGPKQIW